MYTEQFAEAHAPLAAFGATAATTEQNSGYVNMANYHRIAVVFYVLQTTTTLDVDVEITTDGVSAGLFTLKSITQLDSSADDKVVVIEIRAEELGYPVNGLNTASSTNYDWINIEVTPSGACAFTCLVLGIEPRYAPVDQTLYEEVVS